MLVAAPGLGRNGRGNVDRLAGRCPIFRFVEGRVALHRVNERLPLGVLALKVVHLRRLGAAGGESGNQGQKRYPSSLGPPTPMA